MTTDGAAKIRILCVDDNAETRTLFALILRESPDVLLVGSLGETAGLEAEVGRCQPDVVVLDRWMPGKDPLDAMRDAKARHPRVRFLVLSSDDTPAEVERAFRYGASGYGVKDGDYDGLLASIRRVAAGETVRPAGGTRSGLGRP